VRAFYGFLQRPLKHLGIYELLISICRTADFGKAFLAKVTVKTPFLNLALTASWVASSGSDRTRRNAPYDLSIR
jgi:hypothetical protein